MSEDNNPSVMVVDDDEDILYTVNSIFKKSGLPVILAKSGEECLEHLETGFKGVILMDIMMPGMDGWETVQKIVDKGYNDDLIISMFTARDVPDIKQEHLKQYVFDYIVKPFEPEDLTRAVNEYLSMLA